MFIEKKIVKMVLEDAEKAGAVRFEVVDEEGEEYIGDAKETANFHGEVDFWYTIAKNDSDEVLGCFSFVAGNGVDVLSDFSDNEWSHKVVSRAMEYVDTMI